MNNNKKILLLLFILLTPFNLYFCIFIVKKIYSVSLTNLFSIFIALTLTFLLIKYTKVLQIIYIFFHEISHSIPTSLFKGRVFEFKVKLDRGHIKSDINNIWIRLAPYLIPVLPILLLILYYLFLVYLRHHLGEDFQQQEKFSFFIFIITLFFCSTSFYNWKLIFKKTSDIEEKETFLSLIIIINFFIFFSVNIFYLLLNAPEIVEELYFIEKVK